MYYIRTLQNNFFFRGTKSRLACLGLQLVLQSLILAGEAVFTAPLAALDGTSRRVTFQPRERALVFVFLSVDCPIANRCLPELRRLEVEFSTKGVRFVPIYPLADQTDLEIRRHREEFNLNGEPFRDPEHRFAKRFGVRITPEVIAFASGGGILYQGRINDQYTSLGQGKPSPTRHDLADALSDFLATGKILGLKTKPVGCTFRVEP